MDLPGEVDRLKDGVRSHDRGGPKNISRTWLVAELDKHALQRLDGA